MTEVYLIIKYNGDDTLKRIVDTIRDDNDVKSVEFMVEPIVGELMEYVTSVDEELNALSNGLIDASKRMSHGVV